MSLPANEAVEVNIVYSGLATNDTTITRPRSLTFRCTVSLHEQSPINSYTLLSKVFFTARSSKCAHYLKLSTDPSPVNFQPTVRTCHFTHSTDIKVSIKYAGCMYKADAWAGHVSLHLKMLQYLIKYFDHSKALSLLEGSERHVQRKFNHKDRCITDLSQNQRRSKFQTA